MSNIALLRLGAVLLLVTMLFALGACNRCARETPPDDAEPPVTQPADSSVASADSFIEEPEVQPLVASPLVLDNQQLGAGLHTIRNELAATGMQLSESWYELEKTGMITATAVPDAAGPRQLIAFFEGGELVGYQRLEDMDRAAFEAQTAVLTESFGEPVTDLPAFVEESRFYQFFEHEQAAELLFWVHEPTHTALAASLSTDERESMWLLFEPERYYSARADTYAALGS